MSHDFAKKGDAKKGSKASGKKPSAKKTAKKPAAKKTSASKHVGTKKSAPAWLWFLAGVIATVSVQVFYHLSQVDTTAIESADNSGPTAEEAKTFDDEIEKHSKQPEIRFYDELKHRVVPVSGDSVAKREQADYNYALQAGSFKNKSDASQMRAEITLLDLNVKVESRRSDSGTLWHRVIVGPFTSRSKLSRARSILINNNIKSIRIKRS